MSIWSVIETAPAAAAALGWRQWLGPEFGAAAAAGLRETQRRADRVPCPHGCGCGHRVVPARRRDSPEGEFLGVCDCDEPDCEDLRLRAEDVVVWELDLAKLGRAVARALGCDAKQREFGLRRTLQLGSLGSAPLPIVLTVQVDQEAFRSVTGELAARLPKGFILLAPTRRFCDAGATELLGRVNAGFFDLESNLSLLQSGRVQSGMSGAELFRAYLPEKEDGLKQSEATRILALLVKLRSKSTGKKAPLHEVFVRTVLEGLALRSAAEKCGCSLGLLAIRVRELETEFGMPLQRLKSYARPILDMETAVKGDRRRNRKPGSQPGAFADDGAADGSDDGAPEEEYSREENG
jgi:hypothetical protein